MSQNTAQIRKVEDKNGIQFFPITHVQAVVDENGDTIETWLTGKESTSNKVTSLSSSSTNTQYPSAKCVYDLLGDVESLILAL